MTTTGIAVQENESLWRVVNSSFSSNTFIQRAGAQDECFVVDPGLDVHAVDAALTALNLRPRVVCCTHGHFDHVGSATFLLKKYDAAVFLNSSDQRTLNSNNFLLLALKLPHRVELPMLNLVSGENSTVSIGAEHIRFHATPGHTPGSASSRFETRCLPATPCSPAVWTFPSSPERTLKSFARRCGESGTCFRLTLGFVLGMDRPPNSAGSRRTTGR